MTDVVDTEAMARAPFRLEGPAELVEPGLYRIPAGQWAHREANADRLEQLARDFFDPLNTERDERGEAAWWFITGWPSTIVADADVTSCREWLVVRAGQGRIHAFYDSITGRRIISSWSSQGATSTFTPSN
jgi:hypothetical protein